MLTQVSVDPALFPAVRAAVALREGVREVERLRRERDAAVRGALEAGASERELAAATGLARSFVHRLRHQAGLRSGRC